MSAPNAWEISAKTPVVEPYAGIQWKGTQVCMDMYCVCGTNGHIDYDWGPYQVKCKDCGRHYVLDHRVTMFEMTETQVSSAKEAYPDITFAEFSDDD